MEIEFFHKHKRKISPLAVLTTIVVVTIMAIWTLSMAQEKKMAFNKLTPEEERVIINKGTEPPFSGKYYKFDGKGTYLCKRCGASLYKSTDKFDSGCGWPSFDDAIPGAVKRTLDSDGIRTEITCARCGAHLGHVFEGEGFTSKNTRHCVNSISLNFESDSQNVKTEKAYFAGGCFWGTEYLLKDMPGVISARVGYMGGHTKNPTYQEVCEGNTGHAEAVEITFDSSETNYETLAKFFFEIHDPTQIDRQGPDVGDQYRSAIFYTDDHQKETSIKLINILKTKGFKVVTEVAKADTFWEAEKYHQDYYEYTGKKPYCHVYRKKFD